MKKYFSYLSKQSLLETSIVTISVLLINIFFLYLSRPTYAQYVEANNTWIYNTPIVIPGIMMVTITVAVIVILILKAYKLKAKHYTDMMYALPISRRKLVGTHLIVGMIQVVVIVTLSFVGSILVFYALSNQAFKMEFIWLIYPILLILSIVLYSVFQLFIYRANNIIDGIIIVFGYLVVLLMIVLHIQIIKNGQHTSLNSVDESIIFPYFSFDKLSSLLLKNATPNQIGHFDKYSLLKNDLIAVVVHSILYVLLSAVSMIYTIYKVKSDKVENIGGTTRSNLGYKVLNPLIIFFSSIFLFELTGNFSTAILYLLPMLFIVYYVFYIIYRRKFIISKVDFIVIGATLVMSYAMSNLINILL